MKGIRHQLEGMADLDSKLEVFEREALIHLATLLRAAGHMLQSRQEAEDVVQETYLRAWKHFHSFEGGTNCRAWLFRIMLNVINNERNKQSRRPETALEMKDDSELPQNLVFIFNPLERIEGSELLETFDLLTEEHRTVLWLVVVEEFSYREVAEILRVPIGTIMSRLHRSRRELRTLLSMKQRNRRAHES